MFISYPLKVAAPLQLNQNFEQYITQQYGPQGYQPVKETFDKLSNLRNSLDFFKYSQIYAQDPKLCDFLEKSILQYLQYCYMIDTRFRIDYNKPGSITIPFQWSTSFQPVQQSMCYSMKFELSCLYYNFSVIMLASAQNFILKQTTDDYKVALQKLRWGLWAIGELRNNLAYLPQETQNLHYDMSVRNLDIIENSLFGLINIALFSNLVTQENQLGLELVASLIGEAGKYFTQALNTVNMVLTEPKSPFPKDQFQRNKAFVFYYTVFSLCQAALKMSKYHQGLIEDEPKKGHMGWSLGYLRKGSNMIRQALSNKAMLDLMQGTQKENLNQLFQIYNKELPAAEQRNMQIYNHKVPTEGELPGTVITNDKYKVGLQKPSVLANPLPDEKNFSHFLNEETIQIIQQVLMFGEQRKQDSEKAFSALMEFKNKSYIDSQVGYLMDLSSQVGQQVVPPQIQQKIDAFQAKGGADQIKSQIVILKESCVNAGMLLQTCKDKLMQEQQEDQNYRNQYQNKWSSMPSTSLNQEYLKNLQDYEQKFKVAQGVDVEIISKYEACQQYIQLTQLSHNELLAQLPQGGDDGFVKQCKNELLQLQQKDSQLNQQIQATQQIIQQIISQMQSINYPQEVQQLSQKGMSIEQIVQQIFSGVAKTIEQLNQQTQQSMNLIQEIQQLSIQIINKKKQQAQAGNKPIDQYKNGFAQIVEVFEELTQGLNFYNTLYSLLMDIDKKINDFVTARNMEKQTLIQNLGGAAQFQQAMMSKSPQQMQQQVQNYNNYQAQPPPFQSQQPQYIAPYQQPNQQMQMNYQQPPQQQFYQGGQFPIGQSVFVPQGQQQNPFGQNFVQSNVYNPLNPNQGKK